MIKYFFLALAFASSAFAGQLDLAVIQYSTEKDTAQLASGFAGSNLAEIIDSASLSKGDRYIQGGTVIFAQTVPASPGSRLSTSTRLGDTRMDVSTALNGLKLSANISIFTGVKAVLRSFTERSFSGEGDLSSHQPTIIAVQTSTGRYANNIKGKVSMKTIGFTSIVVAQYH